VENVIFAKDGDKKQAKQIVYKKEDKEETIDLVADDLVFITNGCPTDTSCYGSQNEAPDLSKIHNGSGESWDMWHKIAAQDPSFGNPDVFCGHEKESNWMSATIDLKDDTRHSLYQGDLQTRSALGQSRDRRHRHRQGQPRWLVPLLDDQPSAPVQEPAKNDVLVWVYGLYTDVPGNYIKKPMKECTGKEICEEWLYHIGVPLEKIEEIADKHINTTTCYMPYINAFFMPRHVRSSARGAEGLRQLCLHRPVRRDPARYDLHDRIFDPNRHGSGLHLDECRSGCSGNLGQRLRCPRTLESYLLRGR
jgi:oleate hydratase